jgi:flagellin
LPVCLRISGALMIVNTNLYSYSPQRSLSNHTQAAFTAMERLATGTKINSAKDDVAGFAIAERMTSEVRGLSMAVKNANDALGMLSVADTAADDITEMLQRSRELAVQAASDTNSASDRQNLQKEVDSLFKEIDRVATQTRYNGQSILDGSFKEKLLSLGLSNVSNINFSFDSLKKEMLGNFLGTADMHFVRAGTPAAERASSIIFHDPHEIGPYGSAVSLGIEYGDKVIVKGITFQVNGVEHGYPNSPNNNTAAKIELDFSQFGAGNYTFHRHNSPLSDSFTVTEKQAHHDLGDEMHLWRQALLSQVNSSGLAVGQFELNSDGKLEITGNANQGSIWITDAAGNVISSTLVEANFEATYTSITPNGGPALPGIDWYSHTNGILRNVEIYQEGAGIQTLDLASDASTAMKVIDIALNQVAKKRANFGTLQNRLHYTISNLMNVGEQTTAARSRLTDTDYAVESVNLIKAQVLQQGAAAMVAQAQAVPELVLSLIR